LQYIPIILLQFVSFFARKKENPPPIVIYTILYLMTLIEGESGKVKGKRLKRKGKSVDQGTFILYPFFLLPSVVPFSRSVTTYRTEQNSLVNDEQHGG
jgi:hypothetical protein